MSTERPRTPWGARILASVATLAPGVSGTDGLWLIYTGGVVITSIEELEGDEAIDLVVDLATLKPAGPRIPALVEHMLAMGSWTDTTIDPAIGITSRLTLLDGTDPTLHGLPMFDAARQVRAAMAQQFPWQASLGAEPGEDGGIYERITGPTTVNGREIVPGDRPLYVLRNGLLTESSVVLFGADRFTARVAASAARALPPKTVPEPIMADLTLKQRLDSLTTRLGDRHRSKIAVCLAEGQADDQVVSQVAADDKKDGDAKMAQLQTQLDAANAKCAELQAQLDALSPPADDPEKKQDPQTDGVVKAGARPLGAAALSGAKGGAGGTSGQPKNLAQAMLGLQTAGSKLTGIALRRAAAAKYPALDQNAAANQP